MSMSYKQRMVQYHRIFSTFVEDMLASSICWPFTAMFVIFAFLLDTRIFNFLPSRVRDTLIAGVKTLCFFPADCLKGIASILITPLAMAFALRKTEPNREFNVSNKAISAGLILLSILTPLQMLLSGAYISLLVGVVLTLTGAFTAVRIRTLGLVVASLYFASFALAHSVALMTAVVGFAATLPIWLVGAVCLCSWLEGKYQLFSLQLANKINSAISYVETFILVRIFKRNPFKNNQTIIGMENIVDVPPRDLFVSNSNHAFLLEELETNIGFGLLNWYSENEPFDADDFLELEQHPQLNRFPQLKQFMQENRAEYLDSKQISKESLDILFEFGKTLGQNPGDKDFNVNLAAAREKLDKHLAKISQVEKNAIENLQLDSAAERTKGKFKDVLADVAKGTDNGGMCKGYASRCIVKSVERLEAKSKGEQEPALWRMKVRSYAGMGHYADLN